MDIHASFPVQTPMLSALNQEWYPWPQNNFQASKSLKKMAFSSFCELNKHATY